MGACWNNRETTSRPVYLALCPPSNRGGSTPAVWKRAIAWNLSIATSDLVSSADPNKESWTCPLTGPDVFVLIKLLDTIDMMLASARVMGSCGGQMLIWSPSKSALYHSHASTFIWNVWIVGSSMTT